MLLAPVTFDCLAWCCPAQDALLSWLARLLRSNGTNSNGEER